MSDTQESSSAILAEARDKYTVHDCNECDFRKSCELSFGSDECKSTRKSISLAFGIEDDYFTKLLDRIEAAMKRERAIADAMLAVKDKPLPHPDPEHAPPLFAPMTKTQLRILSDLVYIAHDEMDGLPHHEQELEKFDRLLADMKIACARPFSHETVCGVDLAKEPPFAVLQIMRFPGETDEQFRDRVNRALAELDSTRPAPTRKKANEEILYYGPRFFIVDIGDKKYVTRSVARPDSARPLTRRELYDGRMGEAQREYAHAFMCTGFPTKEDPTRPTMEAWLAEEPFEFEVDKFVSEKLFSKEKTPCL